MSGLALADCPDIGGKWGVQLSESLGGEQVAGVGRGTFRDNGTWVLKIYASYCGDSKRSSLFGEIMLSIRNALLKRRSL